MLHYLFHFASLNSSTVPGYHCVRGFALALNQGFCVSPAPEVIRFPLLPAFSQGSIRPVPHRKQHSAAGAKVLAPADLLHVGKNGKSPRLRSDSARLLL